eukprot:COSAG02_NODE_51568_length_313_cov_0.892523_1_plen_39_part_10
MLAAAETAAILAANSSLELCGNGSDGSDGSHDDASAAAV